jgi:hypothetical protein
MPFRSRFGSDSKGMYAAFIFYLAVGVITLVLLPMTSYPPHVGIISVFNLAIAYGLFKKRVWTIWFIVILFFVTTTFSAFMIYNVLARDYILGASFVAYLILTWIFAAYVVTSRRMLER